MKDEALLEKLNRQDYGDFDEKMREAIAYARRLTLSPAEDFSENRARLRQVGWSDGAILEITVVCAYFNMMNRIAQGLEVSLDETTNYAEYMYGENGRMQSRQ